MGLVHVPLPSGLGVGEDLPAPAERYVAAAEARIARFTDERVDDPIPGFVPSDYRAVYAALAHIRRVHLGAGDAFLEWGSGFGVVAGLARLLGYHAAGIESQGVLVAEARRLAGRFGIEVDFAEGSFLPAGAEIDDIDYASEFAWIETELASAYGDLEADIDDFDVVFAFPWPGEQQVVFDLFDEHAARGGLLLTWHGVDGLELQRKR